MWRALTQLFHVLIHNRRMLVPTPCCPPCNPPHLERFSVLPSHILSARKHAHGIICKFEVGSKGVGRKDLNLFVEPALVVIARSMYTCVIPSSASPEVTRFFSAITGDGKRTYCRENTWPSPRLLHFYARGGRPLHLPVHKLYDMVVNHARQALPQCQRCQTQH